MPNVLHRIRRRLRALVDGRALDEEHDVEVAFHIDAEAQDLARAHDLAPVEARRRALAAFGGVTQTREAHREVRGISWIEALTSEVRYSFRTLSRARTFSLSVVLVLALGIGASITAFCAVRAVLLARVPYPQADRLIRISLDDPAGVRFGLSAVDARAIATQARMLSSFGVVRRQNAAVLVGQEPEQLEEGAASAGFFRSLAVRPVLGRSITPADEAPGAPPIAVVAYSLAVHGYGAPERALGRVIMVGEVPHTIVGVLGAHVGDLAGFRASVWTALSDVTPSRRGPFGLLGVGRLAGGATLDGARRELADISRRLFPQWSSSFQDSTARYVPEPLRTYMLGRASDALALLAASVALVLLIVVANVANLALVRAIARRPEIALRQTLGAARLRIARLLMTESIVLALLGGGLGLALGLAGLHTLRLIAPGMPRIDAARIDVGAVGFTIALAAACGVAIGLLPAVLVLRGTTAHAGDGGTRSVSQGRHAVALRGAFVAGQFALALPLLAGAGLLLNSFVRLQQVQPGFDPAHVLTVRLTLPAGRYSTDTAQRQFWTQAIARVRELAGVETVGIGSYTPPYDADACCNNFDLVDHPVVAGTLQPASPWLFASPDYFAALGVPLLEGRAFALGDTGLAPVIAVSESWARHYFPEGHVLGRRLIQGGCVSCRLTTVVAVVGNVKYSGLDSSADAVYSPIAEAWGFAKSATLFIRTLGSPRDVIPGVRAALRSIDPMLPLDDTAPLAARMADVLAPPRRVASVVAGFAIGALLLAAIGIFGMLSYSVSARRREIGIRLALGAARPSLVRSVVAGGMAYAAVGAAVGLVITVVGVGRLAAGALGLFQVRPTDPPTLIAVAAVLLAAAFVASLVPALRAAGTDPLTVIRAE